MYKQTDTCWFAGAGPELATAAPGSPIADAQCDFDGLVQRLTSTAGPQVGR